MKKGCLIKWDGIDITVHFEPVTGSLMNIYREIHGYQMIRIEIESKNREPLPFTDTGYKSLYFPAPDVRDLGGPLQIVSDLLGPEPPQRKLF
jgi:hypothetical protein